MTVITPFLMFQNGQAQDAMDLYTSLFPDSEIVDAITGKAGKAKALKVGQVNHRLLVTLASDFYKPLRLASIYFGLYPREYYNPVSAPTRVHQAIISLRTWIEESGIDLSIEEENGFYRLTGNAGIQIGKKELLGNREGLLLSQLKEKCGGDPFSVSDAAKELGLSSRTALRALQKAIEEGEVLRTGSGASTRYTFSTKQSK